MKIALILTILLSFCGLSYADPSIFARKLCKVEPNTYMCVTIKVSRKAKRQYKEWAEMFPDKTMRHIVMAINRRNTILWNGHVIALPRSYTPDILAYSPFPHEKPWFGSKHVVVDLNKLAWAAYEPVTGQNLRAKLVRWGPANGGSKKCKETGKFECKTHPGIHQILRMYGYGKKSDLYPVDCLNKKICGHPMPFYMVFHSDGTGLHCDRNLFASNISHGCVRMLCQDARWLNKEFAFVGMPVVVENY